MLSAALLPLKQDIMNAINSDAACDAFKKAFQSTFPTIVEGNPDAEEMADSFGKIAAGYFAAAVAGPLGDAIDKYVRSMDLIITPATLVAATVPVTGAISPQEVQIL